MECVRISERMCEHIVGVPVLQNLNENVEVVKLALHEQISGWTRVQVVSPDSPKWQCSWSHVWLLCQCFTV